LFEVWVSVRLLTGKDIVLNAEIYSLGDLEVTSKTPVFAADGKLGLEADKLKLGGRIYTMRGKPYQVPIAGGIMHYRSVWRLAE
jgi:hypothetical protein